MRASKIFPTLLMMLLIVLVVQSCTKAIIDEGAPSSLPPIDRIVTYDADVAPIMFNNCVTCHSGAAPSAGVDLTVYQNVRYYAESANLVTRMNDTTDPMPPSGVVSPLQRQLIDKWVADGFPEN